MERREKFWHRLCSAPYIVWSTIFIAVPLLMVVYYAFTDSNGNITIKNVAQLVDKDILNIFMLSGSYALIATLICLVIAYPLAYVIARSGANTQKTMIMLVMLPMWMNFLLRTYAWMAILENNGIINIFLKNIGLGTLKMIGTPGAVILGMVYNFIPYMVLPIYSVMSKLDKSLIEAAQDLGCNRVKVMTNVVLPLSAPGIVSGITMVFVPSISTFYISQKLGGGTFDLIGDTIERQFQMANNYNLGAAISLVLMVLIFICMAVMNKFTDDENGGGLVV